MSQQVTAELKQWIADQVAAGCTPQSMLQSMLESGWAEPVALVALESRLGTPPATAGLASLAPRNPIHATALPGLPPAVPIPEPLPAGVVATLNAAGREVQVIASLASPRVVVFGGLLSFEECDELVALAQARLSRSQTVDPASDASEVNAARTSEGMFFNRAENALCARIEARIAALLHWPEENGEGLQVLRYRTGAEYKPHFDYFDPDQPGTPAVIQRGGQRVASLVMYLNSPGQGGATVFPDVALEVAPLKGNAVFFSYERPHASTRTLHGGAPVLEGEKWVATKWLRERRFV